MDHYRNLAERQRDFDLVLEMMIETGDSVTRSCKNLGFTVPTFFSWLKEFQTEDRERIERYTQARELANDKMAERLLDIADDVPEKNEMGVDRGDVDNKRVRIDAYKWILSKRSIRYSEKAHDKQEPTDQKDITIVFEEAVKP